MVCTLYSIQCIVHRYTPTSLMSVLQFSGDTAEPYVHDLTGEAVSNAVEEAAGEAAAVETA
jgi:hypothetical protein